MKLGVFSGTFDPVHQGHIAFAQACMAAVGLDKVIFLPEAKPRGKLAVSSLRHRLSMLKLATEQLPGCAVKTIPVEQFTLANALPHLTEQFTHTELYLLLGSDVFSRLHTWPDLARYYDQITFLVGRKVAASQPDAPAGINVTYIQHTDLEVTSTQVRSGAAAPLAAIRPYIASNNLYL